MSVAVPPPEAVWKRVTADLSCDPAAGLNTYRETCERWAGERGKLALILRHPDGRSERWTFFELSREAARASRVFERAGLRRGDRVAAVLTRQIEAFVCALAAWRSGLVYVPLFVGFGADALAQRLAAADVSAVVVDHRWRSVVEAARHRLPADADPHVLTVAGPAGVGIRRGDFSFWGEMESSAPDGPRADTAAGDPATLMFTSGTTSAPKGCLIPHAGFASLVPFVRHCFALTPADLLFATSDPGWSYGLYTTGCTPMALGFPRLVYTGDFDPVAWLRAVEAEQVTYLAGAPSAFRRLALAARRTGMAGSVRGATSAGEPLDADTVAAWTDASSTPIQDGYGLTEVGMVLANLNDPPTEIVPGALASHVPGFEIDLVDADGQPVPDGEQGVIAVRKPRFQLSTGYDNEAAAWDARWVDGRYLTGDLARRDEQGRWWFVGRADDVIVTSGYNVGPVEVETVVLEQAGVAEAAVVAASDPDRGSVVRAVVVRTADAPPEETLTAQIQQAVRDRIGRHAYPRIVDYVTELPRTPTGKLRRGELRAAE